MDLFSQAEERILTVSEITNSVKRVIESSFSGVKIVGEISNFKAHFSGHWYFTLKDAGAQISCTMWKSNNSRVRFTPEDGMRIVVSGNITVYPPRGNYQIDVRSMKADGVGELQAAFERLKKKLSDEGLFDVSHKKGITRLPKRIGIVTAIDSAAFRDMLSVAERRFPLVELIVVSSRVQGEGAAEEISKGIKKLDSLKDLDTIIVGRGGGSLEDLWAFNEEIVARTVFDAQTPIISGVGHEIDFTITDFVADLRAPTPTASMELATPDKEEILNYLIDFNENSTANIISIIGNLKDEISGVLNSYGFKSHDSILKNKMQLVDNYLYKIDNEISNRLSDDKYSIDLFKSKIESYNIDKTLKRGFALIKQSGKIVESAKDFDEKKKIKIKFYDNEIEIK